MFKKLNLLLSKHDKKFLLFLLGFSIFVSIIETIGISVIMPFIAVASDFSVIQSNKYYHFFYELFNFKSEISFVIAFGILLICFYVMRSIINFSYSYFLAKFSKGRYYVIAYRIFENYLGMPCRNFIERNSSELTKTVISEAQNLTSLISSLLFMLSEIFVIVLIYSILLYVNWKIALVLTVALGANALLMTQTVSKFIRRLGEKRAHYEKNFFKVVNTTLSNFKMIKLHGDEEKILKTFSDTGNQFARTYIVNEALSNLPRLFLEALGFSIVVALVVYLVYANQTDISNYFGVLSVFVLGLYRLMPSFHRILSSYNNIQFNRRSLDIVHNDLIYEVEDLGNEKVVFSYEIKLNHLSFSYMNNKEILKDIDLTIKRGEKIAFAGESGSGKSTLVDIIIGLYRPKRGTVYIDDQELNEQNIRDWRKKIGYIPQSIYLFDGTVAENVAMGDKINNEKMIMVLKKANIWDFLEKHHNGMDTLVGEGGTKLSGGQKQRVAIARALYSDPEILVLDEATSALDNETEAKIMDEIYDVSEDKTLIIIAHRLSTLDRCEKIYQINNGEIVPQGKMP